jgi:hypothetical protein
MVVFHRILIAELAPYMCTALQWIGTKPVLSLRRHKLDPISRFLKRACQLQPSITKAQGGTCRLKQLYALCI